MGRDNITLVVSAKDLASGVFRRVSASTVAFGVALGNLASKAIAGAINGLRGWINEALESEKANVMLDASLRGVGAYTPQLAQQFRDLAGAVQNETGASDESTKAIISQLVAIGVAPDKIAAATRATKALEAIGKGGAQSMTALARALEGDIKGFERLIPAVRMAATEEEKYAALNATLAAGYEQQKANLQTVGGAWEALKGRLGDAREAIIGAVFEGAKIGTTFDDAQAAVGRFLESDSFTAFTDKLRSGAAYVRQIIDAMGADGGVGEVADAFGSIVLAAIKEGADYFAQAAGDAIDKATGGMRTGWRNVRQGLGNAGAALGSAVQSPEDLLSLNPVTNLLRSKKAREEFARRAREGADFAAANQEYAQPDMTRGESQLDAALSRFRAVVSELAAQHKAAADAARETRTQEIEAQQPMVDMTAALARRAKAEQDAADEATRKVAIQEQIAGFQRDIKDAAEEEAKAKKKLATLESDRAKAASMNINAWIEEKQNERDVAKQNERDLKRANRRASTLERKSWAGTNLSPEDRQWLKDFNENRGLAGAAGQDMVDEAAKKVQELKTMQDAFNIRIESLQGDMLTAMEDVRDYLKDNLEVP